MIREIRKKYIAFEDGVRNIIRKPEDFNDPTSVLFNRTLNRERKSACPMDRANTYYRLKQHFLATHPTHSYTLVQRYLQVSLCHYYFCIR